MTTAAQTETRLDGFTAAELNRVFSEVQDPADWKSPICRRIQVGTQIDGIDARQLHGIAAAVEFYTATKAAVTVEYDPDCAAWFATVTADGYRLGPAGDH